MANILQSINNSYKRTAKNLEQLSLIIFILAIGIFAVTFVNKSANKNTDNAFECYLTPQNEVLRQDTSPLSTVMQLSLINNETELFKSAVAKNEIPAIENPRFGSYKDLSICMEQDEPVYIVKIGDIIKVYPQRLIELHIVINDYFNTDPILIVYSPLADLFRVYERKVKDENSIFGVSGYLYNNTDLVFDSKTQSLWSPVDGRALVGNLIGAELTPIGKIFKMTFGESIERYPDALYMNYDTGFRLDYDSAPFAEYRIDNKVIENIENYSELIPAKSQIQAFVIDEEPFHFFPDAYEPFINSQVNIKGIKYTADFDGKQLNLTNMNNGNDVPVFPVYWFVWYDNYPKTLDPFQNE